MRKEKREDALPEGQLQELIEAMRGRVAAEEDGIVLPDALRGEVLLELIADVEPDEPAAPAEGETTETVEGTAEPEEASEAAPNRVVRLPFARRWAAVAAMLAVCIVAGLGYSKLETATPPAVGAEQPGQGPSLTVEPDETEDYSAVRGVLGAAAEMEDSARKDARPDDAGEAEKPAPQLGAKEEAEEAAVPENASLGAEGEGGDDYAAPAPQSPEGDAVDTEPVPDDEIVEADSAPGEALAMYAANHGVSVRHTTPSEGDVVCTDGQELYILTTDSDGSQAVAIVDADTMELRSELRVEGDGYVQDLYLEEDRLVLISRGGDFAEGFYELDERVVDATDPMFEAYNDAQLPTGETALSERPITVKQTDPKTAAQEKRAACGDVESTELYIYDVSDAGAPVLTRSYEQDGRFTAAGLQDGMLYLVTGKQIAADVRGDDAYLSEMVPVIYDSAAEEQWQYLQSGQIVLPDTAETASYTQYSVISAMEVHSISAADAVAVLGDVQTVHIGADAVYLAADSEEGVVLEKIVVADGVLQPAASSTLPGSLAGQEVLDAYDGQLRVLLDTEDGQSLVVLDEALQETGRTAAVEGIETLYYAGDRAYLQLVREGEEVLLTAHLEEADNPYLAGDTALDGLQALYPLEEGLLLTLEQPGEDLILTLYDTTPELPRELAYFAIEGAYSVAAYEPQRLRYRAGEQLLGLPVRELHEDGAADSEYWLLRCTADEGITLAAVLTGLHGDGATPAREVWIGEKLYLISRREVRAIDLQTFEETGRVAL